MLARNLRHRILAGGGLVAGIEAVLRWSLAILIAEGHKSSAFPAGCGFSREPVFAAEHDRAVGSKGWWYPLPYRAYQVPQFRVGARIIAGFHNNFLTGTPTGDAGIPC